MTDLETRPGGAHARLAGAQALAAAAPAAFAPLAVMALSLYSAPIWSVILAVISAAPLVALAGVAAGRAAPAWMFAAATAPLALAAAFFAWSSGGALSPAAPWMFAALLSAAVLGGARGALGAGLAAAAFTGAIAAGVEPPIRLIGFQPHSEREIVAAISWGAACAAASAAVWAALSAWATALPPLRHPTIAARRALSVLAQAGEICALRIDPKGGVLQTVGAPEATLSIDRDALRGMNVSAIVHPDDQDALATLLRDRARRADMQDGEGDPVLRAAARLTVRMHSKLGGFRWIEAEAWPADAIPPAPGVKSSPDDSLLVLRARWRADAETEGDADPERSGFLAHVNGELRNALKSVVGYTEILKNELFGPLGAERYRDYARRAHEGGAHVLELVDELLDLAAIEAGRFTEQTERIDPAPLADGAIRLVRNRAEEAGVALAAEVAPNTPHIIADRRGLRRVLVNMMLDAVSRGRMGDIAKLRVDAEDDAVRFQLIAVARPSAVGAFPGAPVGDRPQDPAAEGFGAPAALAAEDDETLQARLSEARLGRLVAASLAERMGGGVMFADPIDADRLEGLFGAGFARTTGGRESVYAEAILPIAPQRAAAELDAAAAAELEAQRRAELDAAVKAAPEKPAAPEPDESDVPMFELGEGRRAPGSKAKPKKPKAKSAEAPKPETEEAKAAAAETDKEKKLPQPKPIDESKTVAAPAPLENYADPKRVDAASFAKALAMGEIDLAIPDPGSEPSAEADKAEDAAESAPASQASPGDMRADDATSSLATDGAETPPDEAAADETAPDETGADGTAASEDGPQNPASDRATSKSSPAKIEKKRAS